MPEQISTTTKQIRKTKLRGFRIYESQAQELDVNYSEKASILVRVLLEEYFANRLPVVKIKFQNAVKTRELDNQRRIENKNAALSNTITNNNDSNNKNNNPSSKNT